MKYPACGSGIHRLVSRAASVKSMKKKFSSKMSTACYGTECKYKKAMGDVKWKGLPDPYAYSPLTRNVLRKRKRMKFAGQFKNIVKIGTRTKRRFQAIEMRFLRNLENKTLLREYADRKTKVINAPQAVKERICKRVWKKRQKQLSAYISNSNVPGESCHKGWRELLSTHPHKEREGQVINSLSVNGRLQGKFVTKLNRTIPLLFTNKMWVTALTQQDIPLCLYKYKN